MKQDCYKNTKSPREIRRYIRRQAWYESFRQLVWMNEKKTFREKLRTLWGYEGSKTIVCAFDWSRTVMLYREWKSINEAFNAWYVNE